MADGRNDYRYSISRMYMDERVQQRLFRLEDGRCKKSTTSGAKMRLTEEVDVLRWTLLKKTIELY